MGGLTTTSTTNPATASGLRVVERSFESVSDEFIEQWAELESRSVEGNAFLSPHFVIPAVTHLEGAYEQKPLILAVESTDGSELLAVGLFEQSGNSRLLPLTHLRSWRCEHTFHDGLLVDRDRGTEALVVLFDWLSRQNRRWHGIAFTDRSADGKLNQMLGEAAATTGAVWFEDWHRERAVIPVNDVPEDCLRSLYSKNRRRNFKRSMKQLEASGKVCFSLLGAGSTTDGHIEAFLQLEAMGWKGAAGTSLLSTGSSEKFCREMAVRFADDRRLIICELSVDGVPIASSLNMQSNSDVFGFKIGWNPEFADCSPGLLNELHFLQSCREHLPDVNLIDSCAKPGSYVEDVWPWKRRLTTGVFTTSRTGTLAASAMTQLKRLKRLLKKA
ncbi:MAG: GNAT family N-acetyltransferase [Planctomycetota bacterium]|nr:GNAT family N-acetyltransferase [Planctomycetota bacterium]MDA1165037.1 GNAT family N-acetyltransferase [Planctomycetota bacterium]